MYKNLNTITNDYFSKSFILQLKLTKWKTLQIRMLKQRL